MSKIAKIVSGLVLLLALVGFFGVYAPSVAAQTATTAQPQHVTGTQCRDFDERISRVLFTMRLNGQVCWDGSRAWVTRVDCNYYTYGTYITQSYCGVIKNNSYPFAEVGSNFQVDIAYKGFPISYGSYMRLGLSAVNGLNGWLYGGY